MTSQRFRLAPAQCVREADRIWSNASVMLKRKIDLELSLCAPEGMLHPLARSRLF
jgi:hypothetical protein